MERAMYFSNELFGTTSEDKSARLGTGTSHEQIKSVGTDLTFFKGSAGTKMMSFNIIDRSLNGSTDSLDHTHKIFIGYTTGTKDVAIGKILRGEITNGKFGKDDLGTRGNNLFKFIIDDGPFSIDNGLVVLLM